MINKLTIQERFFIFLGLVCLAMMYTNHYYHYKYDNDIQRSLQRSDNIVKRHVADSLAKSMAIDYWKSMYLTQKGYSESLERKISNLKGEPKQK